MTMLLSSDLNRFVAVAKIRRCFPAAILVVLICVPAQAQRAPANSLRELRSELDACVRAPGGPVGSAVTIVFALKRDGALLGRPRISQAHLVGEPGVQRSFVAGAIAALGRCLPVSVTDSLGGAIAGRLFSIRLIVRPKETDA